jgi:hypothetical protein
MVTRSTDEVTAAEAADAARDAAVAERVARGAALLDARAPGWAERVKLDALEMVSPCLCVLGQLFAAPPAPVERDGYWIGLERLGIPAHPVNRPAAYGFAEENPDSGAYLALTDEWERVIAARRAGGA